MDSDNSTKGKQRQMAIRIVCEIITVFCLRLLIQIKEIDDFGPPQISCFYEFESERETLVDFVDTFLKA